MSDFAFEIEDCVPGFVPIFCKIVFCKEFKLSKRESEVLALIYLGVSMNEISLEPSAVCGGWQRILVLDCPIRRAVI